MPILKKQSHFSPIILRSSFVHPSIGDWGMIIGSSEYILWCCSSHSYQYPHSRPLRQYIRYPILSLLCIFSDEKECGIGCCSCITETSCFSFSRFPAQNRYQCFRYHKLPTEKFLLSGNSRFKSELTLFFSVEGGREKVVMAFYYDFPT